MKTFSWSKINDCLINPTRAKERIWEEAQKFDKQAVEAYLGCSIEEAKEMIDNRGGKVSETFEPDLSEQALEELVQKYSPNPGHRHAYRNGLSDMMALVKAAFGCTIEEAKAREARILGTRGFGGAFT